MGSPGRRSRTGGRLLAGLLILAACAGPAPRTAPPGAESPPPAPGAPSPTPAPATPSPSPPPSPAGPDLVFAVKGDWGIGSAAQHRVTEAMCRLRETVPFDAVVTTGDNFYRPDGVATRKNYHEPEACLVSRPGHRWVPSWGNHDLAGRSTGEVLGAPGRWYAWREGPAEVFVLDSTRAGDAGQLRWLEEALSASTAPVRIAAFHHPPYTVGHPHPSDESVRRWFVPLFRRHGVALVLAGHNHLYEHAVVDGVHYVTTGGGGGPLYRCARTEEWMLRCLERHHFLLVEVRGTQVTVAAVGADGEELDRFPIRSAG